MSSAVLAVLVASLISQSPTQSYAGVWVAEHNGTTYVRLNLQITDGHLAGTISLADSIHVDPQGEVDRATAAPETATAIQEIKVTDGVLSFSRKDDGGDVDRFEMRLTGDQTAGLSLMLDEDTRQELASDGVPVPRPFRITKTK
jgi:hypothetical protein